MARLSEETKERMRERTASRRERQAKLPRMRPGSEFMETIHLADRAMGIPIGTIASALPGGAKPSMMEGISSALEEIPDKGATFEDFHRAITAYQEPFEARKGYWGASELVGGMLLPTYTPMKAGSLLMGAAPKISKGFYKGASALAPKKFKPPQWEQDWLKSHGLDEWTTKVRERSSIGKAAEGLQETLTGIGKTMKVPWEAEEMLGRQLVKPLRGVANVIRRPRAVQNVDTEIVPDLTTKSPKPGEEPIGGAPNPGEELIGGGKFNDSIVSPLPSMKSAVHNVMQDTGMFGLARKIASLPVVNRITKGINPSALAKSPNAVGIVARFVLQDLVSQRVSTAMSKAWRIGNQESVFGKTDEFGSLLGTPTKLSEEAGGRSMLPIGDVHAFRTITGDNSKLRGYGLNDIRTHHEKWRSVLNKDQNDWLDALRESEQGITDMFEKAGINVKKLFKDESGVWAGRRVVKYNSAGDAEIFAIPNKIRPKGLTPMEKQRKFITQREAMDNGFKYMPEDQAVAANLKDAYERIIDVDFATWMKRYVKELEELPKRGKPQRGVVELPGKQGRAVYVGKDAEEMAQEFSKAITPDITTDKFLPKSLSFIAKANTIGRYMMLNGDASPFMIQLLFLAGQSPKQWGRSIQAFVQAWWDPRYHQRLLYENADVIRDHPHMLMSSAGNEFTEALSRGGLLMSDNILARVPRTLLEPFGRAFNASLDAAGIHMAKALDDVLSPKIPKARSLDELLNPNARTLTSAQRQQVDAFINEFRGLASSSRLGVRKTMRDLESSLLLAPRYNRAIAALVFDMADGGIRGELARKAMKNSVTALVMANAAFTMVDYWKNTPDDKKSKEGMFGHIVDHLNPTSSRFFTWKVGNTNMGPGTKVRSLIYTMAKALDEPSNLLEWEYNPALNFARGNLSPVGSTAWDVFTGYNYVGDPIGFTDGLEEDFLTDVGQTITKVALPDLMPIWVQTLLLEEGTMGQKAAMASADFFGLRSYPVTRMQLKDEEARKRGYDNYKDLDKSVKYMIDAHVDKVHGKDYRGEVEIRYESERDKINEKFIADTQDIADKVLTASPETIGYSPKHARTGSEAFDVVGLNELKSERFRALQGKWNPDTQKYEGGLNPKIYGEDWEQDKEKAKWGTREYNVERYYDLFDQAMNKKNGKIDWDYYREREQMFWNSLSAADVDELLRNIRVIEGEYPPAIKNLVDAGRYALTQKITIEGEKTSYYNLKTHRNVVTYLKSHAQVIDPGIDDQSILAFIKMNPSERAVMAKEEVYARMEKALKKAESEDGVLWDLRTKFIDQAPSEWLFAMFESGYEYLNYKDYNKVIEQKLRDGWSLPKLDYVDLLKGQLYPDKFKTDLTE